MIVLLFAHKNKNKLPHIKTLGTVIRFNDLHVLFKFYLPPNFYISLQIERNMFKEQQEQEQKAFSFLNLHHILVI